MQLKASCFNRGRSVTAATSCWLAVALALSCDATQARDGAADRPSAPTAGGSRQAAAREAQAESLAARVNAELPENARRLFSEASRQWRRYREVECRRAGDHVSTQVAQCRLALAEIRLLHVTMFAPELEPGVQARDSTDDVCPDAMTTPEMQSCLEEAAEKANTMLVARESQLRRALPATRWATLANARDAWIEYEQSLCRALVAQSAGGSIVAVQDPGCRLGLAEDRLRLLTLLY